MLYSNITDFDSSDYAKIMKALDYLKTKDFTQIADGRIEIDDQMYVQVLSYDTEDISELPFERHHNRLDLHYLAAGEEIIYAASRTNLNPSEPYNSERDIEFLETPNDVNGIHLKTGDFLLIGMNEPHKTNGWVSNTSSKVKKVVVKLTK